MALVIKITLKAPFTSYNILITQVLLSLKLEAW